jgi:hypothetical protein
MRLNEREFLLEALELTLEALGATHDQGIEVNGVCLQAGGSGVGPWCVWREEDDFYSSHRSFKTLEAAVKHAVRLQAR